jgi:hypothetical protein
MSLSEEMLDKFDEWRDRDATFYWLSQGDEDEEDDAQPDGDDDGTDL